MVFDYQNCRSIPRYMVHVYTVQAQLLSSPIPSSLFNVASVRTASCIQNTCVLLVLAKVPDTKVETSGSHICNKVLKLKVERDHEYTHISLPFQFESLKSFFSHSFFSLSKRRKKRKHKHSCNNKHLLCAYVTSTCINAFQQSQRRFWYLRKTVKGKSLCTQKHLQFPVDPIYLKQSTLISLSLTPYISERIAQKTV